MVTLMLLYTLPFLVTISVLLTRYDSVSAYFIAVVCFAIHCLIVFLSFSWEIVGNRFKFAFIALALALLFVSMLRNYSALADHFLMSLTFFTFIVCATLWLSIGRAIRPTDDGLMLTSPLTTKCIVAHGGGNRIQNLYHRRVEAQKQALDLIVVDKSGVRARGLIPKELTRYYSYGEKVVAPVDAVIARTEDGQDDMPIGEMDEKNPAGNFVFLHVSGKTLVLAHLMKGSISVREGDRVVSGDAIGRIGNSGNTSEPHLHIHAVEGCVLDESVALFHAKPIPLFFDSRYLRKGDFLSSTVKSRK